MKQARQPVFKPLSNSENSSLFTFEQSQRPSAPLPFARTNENQNLNTSGKVIQDTGTERLSSLHAKLHQEADKIRKWKVQTEIELKQKEKKIQEASSTNESLRKSILELQLQNENLSLKLQEEIGNREDIVQRITSTRQLCNILKDHAVKLEEKVHQCETERTELKYMEKEHSQQFDELSREFKKLEISSLEDHNSLVNQLQVERDDRTKLEEELESKLNEAEVQLKSLMDQCDEKDIEIRDVRTMLQRNDEKLHTLELNIGNLTKKLETQEEETHLKESNLQTSLEQLQHVKDERDQHKDKIDVLSVEAEKLQNDKTALEKSILTSEAEYGSDKELLQQKIVDLTNQLQAENERVHSFEQQLSEMVVQFENLKSSKDFLLLEKTQLEGTVTNFKNNIATLQVQNEEQAKAYSSLTEDHRTVYENLESCKHQLVQLQELMQVEKEKSDQKDKKNNELQQSASSLENSIKEKEEQLAQLVNQSVTMEKEIHHLKMEVEKLDSFLKDEREKSQNTVKTLNDSMAQLTLTNKTLNSTETDMRKLRRECEKSAQTLSKTKEEKDDLTDTLKTLKEENSNLTSTVEDLEAEVEKLKEENEEHGKSKDEEVQSKSKQVSTLESKQKELKSEVTSKNKRIKDLEKELKGLKTKLNLEAKAVADKCKEYTELADENEMMKMAVKDLESEKSLLCEKLTESKAIEVQAVKEKEEMKARTEQALTEKRETEQKFEFQLSEMMATMGKYKRENHKIVQQKEKELALLKSKTDQFCGMKQKDDKQLEELQKVNEELKLALVKEAESKNDMSTNLLTKDDELHNLEQRIHEKELKIQKLEKEIKAKKLAKKKASVSASGTQTSPVSSPLPSVQLHTARTPHIGVADESAVTPQCGLKTPQRSILRNLNSVSKRRKVVFSSHDDSGRHSASDSDSSSELMEVEMETLVASSKPNKKTTPLLIRPSPKLHTPKVDSPDKSGSLQKTPLKRVPRGPPVKTSQKQKDSIGRSYITEEIDQFHSLYPDGHLHTEKENKSKKIDPENPNVRKTPSKNTSKFFKASPKDRFSKKAKHLEKEEIAWFDLDTVFGFGPED